MSKVKTTKNKIKSKIEAIKKINDDPRKTVDDIYDKYLKDLPSTDQLFKTTFGGLSERKKRKKENKKDIFSEMIDTVEGFLGFDEPGKPPTNSRERLKQYTQESTHKTLLETKNIILNAAKDIFFAGDGVCGTNRNIPTPTTLFIKPKEFDIMNVLSVSPNSNSGQIMYEPENANKGYVKMNRNFYNSFTTPTGFTSNNGVEWFDMSWDGTLQQFQIDLKQTDNNFPYVRVDEFLNDYYSSVELPDITAVTKTAMLMILKGDGDNSVQFDVGMNEVERLLKKLCAICGNPTNPKSDLQQNAVDQFNENDEDLESYFNFDDVEGIDLDDEDARLRKVLKFKDCGNFEVPVNTKIFEGFVYLSKKKNINDVVDSTLNRLAKDAQLQNSNVQIDALKLSLLNDFILQLPKAMLSLVLSPKLIFPVVLIFKYFKSSLVTAATTIKDIMKYMRKFFNRVIRDMFWKFLTEFWSLVKRDLLAFLTVIISKILKNKYKRYVTIITALIFLLKKILETGLDNCQDIFNTILNTITNALSASVPLNVPSLLLGMSDMLPGYSQDRAAMNINERLSSLGFDMGPIFGDENKLPLLIKSIIDGHQEEMDANSFVKISLKPAYLPGPMGGAIIPPGLISGAGKIF